MCCPSVRPFGSKQPTALFPHLETFVSMCYGNLSISRPEILWKRKTRVFGNIACIKQRKARAW